MLKLVGILGLLVVAAAAYIRLAPSDPARWHVPLTFDADQDSKYGVQRVVQTGPDGLARLDALIGKPPLAGSVAEGHATYVVRTPFWGFPDYVTAQQDGDRLRIFSRLRFGRSDLGVNGRRVEQWLAVLKAG
ncbi:DUF1499 domain-containing protein [Seohaeicola zhoushanensis]|uniref:DUF1499 domain-containing protein n=1 Tax=Seohaeicola zhoushanensis TaxID=1569283 RepID=A0A8J3H2J6_9RHOB|nr:DUF1499 domain-containing protein [Seohaeicola zhoushanensis]GHF71568.1 hypothetical protein GCM10017056_48110 [Seohaeicola zhoushanensis]